MIDKLNTVRVNPVQAVERVTRYKATPTPDELVKQSESWPMVQNTVVVTDTYNVYGKLVASDRNVVSTYA